MSEAAIPDLAIAWPQVLVLASSLVAFITAAAWCARQVRAGLPLIPPRPHEEVCWDAGDVAVVVVLYLLGATAMTEAGGPDRAPVTRLVGNAVLSLGALLAGVAWLRFRGADRGMLGFRPHAGDLALAVRSLALVVLPLLLLAAGLNAVVRYEHPIIDFLSADRGRAAAMLVAVSAIVVAPLAEEFFFRRILQGWLEKHFAGEAGVAVALSSIAFAAAHAGQGMAFVPLFALALLLGRIAERTGSIVPCVLLHGMFNAVSVFLLLAGRSLACCG